MLTEFLRWWGRNLAGLLSGWSQEGEMGNRLLLTLDGATATVSRCKAGREIVVAREACDAAGMARLRRRAAMLLRAGDGMALERVVDLPLAAEANLASVLRLEMDRLSPFTADEVFWSYAILARDPAQGRIAVRLSLMPRSALTAALETAARLGLAPAGIAARVEAGTWRRFDLRTGDAAARSGLGALRLAAASCALLGLIAAGLPVALQQLRLRTVDAQIAGLRPAVAESERLRREIAAGQAGAAALAKLGGGVEALAVLAIVTEALPDDTFLTEFVLHAGKLELRGQSRNAARLIGLLSETPDLRAAGFAAPLTRADTEAVELFAINAMVAP